LLFIFPNYGMTMTTSLANAPVAAAATATRQATKDPSIRTLTIDVPQSQLNDLRRRIVATQWPEKEPVADASQGVQLATMQALARYWSTEYDWRKVEARLNALPQYITEIDGLGHSFHSRPLETQERVAAHRHARVARLDHRAAEDHRSADESNGTWRERLRRF
jgi:hypothetical protein